MLAGMIYDPSNEGLKNDRIERHSLCAEFNSLKENDLKRKEILKKLFPNADESFSLMSPCHFDYGYNIHIGKNSFANFNFTVLNTCEVIIGDDVFIGVNVTLATPIRPLLSEERRTKFNDNGSSYDDEYGGSIEIGSGTWLASNVIIGPNLKIGRNCVIGMGSVVTRDIPDGYLAFGNPCKPIRRIDENDSIYLKRRLFEK